jgi:hypothetical protein
MSPSRGWIRRQASNNEDETVPRPSVGLMIPIRHGLLGRVS